MRDLNSYELTDTEKAYRKKMEKDGWTFSDDGLQMWKRRENGSMACESVPLGETETQQQFKDDCDANIILPRLAKEFGSDIPRFTTKTGVYGDFTEIGDYRQAVETVMKADSLFNDLPAQTRLKFDNDPHKLVEYLADPANMQESIDLGLRMRPESQPVNETVEQLKQLNENIKASTKSRKSKSDEE